MATILITGGAGFIGTHLTHALHAQGDKVIMLDNLLPQVHKEQAFSPELRDLAECVTGDVRDLTAWSRLAADHPDINVIVHLAALTGTGQSMYALREYDSVNCGGTATLLEAVLDRRQGNAFPNLRRVVLASSRAIYGEGAYRCPLDREGELRYPPQRTAEQLAQGRWGFFCPEHGAEMAPVATPESAPPQPASFYGINKLVQEQYIGTMLTAAGIAHTMLRFQNVFGPGQSLKNPYTGVIGVFYSSIMQGRALDIYEDGEITRDFVYVTDVVNALVKSITGEANGVFNIGSGEFTRLADVARWLCEALEREVPIGSCGAYRVGDIRHNAADLGRAQTALGYHPQVSARDGLRAYVHWAQSETPMDAATLDNASAALQAAGFSRA
jgi:dTDP-L-rhamnose 4-epimerase